MTNSATFTFLCSFSLASIIIYWGIFFLKKAHLGQAIRKLGPKNHNTKAGTPNIGGALMIIAIIITYMLLLLLKQINIDYSLLFMLFMPLIAYGTLGFLDDTLKATQRTNDGISPKGKLFFQILWAVLYFIIFLDNYDTKVNLFGFIIDLKWLYGVFILFLFVSSSNAFNLCDGLDGLSSGLAIIILIGLLIIINNQNNEKSLMIKSLMIRIFIIALLGTIFAFWLFNLHPAKIFMGDSGSLAIGATIANLCIIMKVEALILIFGLVMIIETLSVIIQVIYFKLTKGKRIFLMTPLHHHFELKGIKEEKVSIIFWIIQFIAIIIGLIIYQIQMI